MPRDNMSPYHAWVTGAYMQRWAAIVSAHSWQVIRSLDDILEKCCLLTKVTGEGTVQCTTLPWVYSAFTLFPETSYITIHRQHLPCVLITGYRKISEISLNFLDITSRELHVDDIWLQSVHEIARDNRSPWNGWVTGAHMWDWAVIASVYPCQVIFSLGVIYQKYCVQTVVKGSEPIQCMTWF